MALYAASRKDQQVKGYDKASSPDSGEFETIEDRRKGANGQIVVTKYLKGKLLGKGGFAHCYWCSCVETGEIFAMKVVEKSSLTKSRAKEKLQAEIRIHRKLSHGHVVKFHRFFEDRKRVYILLGLCSNHTLSELMKRRKRLTELEVRYYGMQLLKALKYLHAENVIHRDLKLGNLFIDKEMQIQVGDFGLAAKVTDVHDRKRTICGTPNYIAPEILENRNGHSFQVDIWSFGVILYTLLVGKPPYEARDVKSTYKRIVANIYTFPEDIHVSDEAKSIIRRMLQTKPELRPSLDEIERHPFFAAGPNIPIQLPEASLASAPTLADCLMVASTFLNKHTLLEKLRNDENAGDGHRELKKENGKVPIKVPVVVRRPLGVMDTNTLGTRNFERVNTDVKAYVEEVENVPPVAEFAQKQHFEIFNDFNTGYECKIAASSQAPGHRRNKEHQSIPMPISPEYAENKADIKLIKLVPAPFRSDHKVSPEDRLAAAVQQLAMPSSGEGHPNQEDFVAMVEGIPDKCVQHLNSHAGSPVKPDLEEDLKVIEEEDGVKMDQQDKDTLEALHDRLSQSLADCAIDAHHLKAIDSPEFSGRTSADGLWVVRYVDYTSKYGLGFLLSNGSTGVYFNDASKIVMSPNGAFFDYIERGREGGKDTTIERHISNCYPSHLQKKVTLLNHFSNYLIQQEKRKRDEGRSHMPQTVNLEIRENNSEEISLVYVKKWVKTRHAILFRLSSRTVQVTFFDQSEITLSSEARAVMYIDKDGCQTKYSLLGVLRSGRQDIIKRLRYTKDILHQLISQQRQA